MQHTFQINTSQLSLKFIELIQSRFGSTEVKIVIEEIHESNKNLNTSERKRFLDHRKSHPPINISKKDDFNVIVDDVNLD